MRRVSLRRAATLTCCALLALARPALAEGGALDEGSLEGRDQGTYEVRGEKDGTSESAGEAGAGGPEGVSGVPARVPVVWVTYSLLRADSTSPTGSCTYLRSYSQAWLDANPAVRHSLDEDRAEVARFLADNPGTPACPSQPPAATVDAVSLTAPLRAAAVKQVPAVTVHVQPNNSAVTGLASYLDGDHPMTFTGTATLTFVDGTSTNVSLTGSVVEYWVDWDATGVTPASAPPGVHAATTGGPYTQAPTPWRDGQPGSVGHTYQYVGTYEVVVTTTWQVTGDAPGVGQIGPVTVTVDSAPLTLDVQQGQAVRTR